MKTFFKDIIIGLCCFCTIWMAGEFIFDKFKGQNKYSYKYNYVKNNKHIKTLLIGHSHAEYGINPKLLGNNAFNFAMAGRYWIYWDVMLTKQLLPTMPNLNTIIFPLSYLHPYMNPHYKYMVPEDNSERMFLYSKYMKVNYGNFFERVTNNSSLWHNKMSTKFWEDEPLLCDTLGYIAKHGKADESKRRSMFDENLVYGETAELCCNEYKMYLTELAKVCKENGVRFIVITSPHTDRYLAKTNIKGLNTMHDIIDHVNRYYPIEYKNYMNDADFRSDSLYFDDQHLNSVGTDIFTLRIKKDFGI